MTTVEHNNIFPPTDQRTVIFFSIDRQIDFPQRPFFILNSSRDEHHADRCLFNDSYGTRLFSSGQRGTSSHSLSLLLVVSNLSLVVV